jgi:membrane protein involved in colicin uptake
MEKTNCCLYNDIESLKLAKAEAERHKSTQIFAESDWLAERKALLAEIDDLKASGSVVGKRPRSRSNEGYRSGRAHPALSTGDEYNRYYETNIKVEIG